MLFDLQLYLYGLSIFKISLTIIFLPIYGFLTWHLHTRPEFKTISYQIISTIAVFDCFYLLQSMASGFVTLANLDKGVGVYYQIPDDCFTVILSCGRGGYMLSAPLMFGLMAYDRFLEITGNKNIRSINRLTEIGIIVACLMFLANDLLPPLLRHKCPVCAYR
ncbi:hypothetical protein L596_029316 [Steinernema carpocapsae]|uniref:G-protein coupled receptors family 1 profile domain-containing protein n=1 Tax=Steinernema carpocapsae TaxID=34508 RepID=A0A4U5LUA3_STECR|nr:hypothetical protein L596_029316 [Steinernema carpocapsae]